MRGSTSPVNYHQNFHIIDITDSILMLYIELNYKVFSLQCTVNYILRGWSKYICWIMYNCNYLLYIVIFNDVNIDF